MYVGLESADSLQKRVDLALKELDRTNAWSREVIAVFTTTGTGWVDERAASPLEYMYNGDTRRSGCSTRTCRAGSRSSSTPTRPPTRAGR